jgi:hypothetical protein
MSAAVRSARKISRHGLRSRCSADVRSTRGPRREIGPRREVRTPNRRLIGVLLIALVSVVSLAATADPGDNGIRLIGRFTHEPLTEISGITRSSYPDIFWVHNDSGDSARIFAVDLNGDVVIPNWLRAQYEDDVWPGIAVHHAVNIDWEDITQADGVLYIADMGNNGNARRDLGVYVLKEPNPMATGETRALKFLPVSYPDQEDFPPEQWHFDSEALFIDHGRLYFMTKHRQQGRINSWESGVRLYRLDTAHTDSVNVLTFVSQRDDVMLVTGADMSPDGERLAVLSYTAVWVFERPPEGDDWLSGEARRFLLNPLRTRKAEGITWRDDQTLLIASEDRDLFELPLASLRPVDQGP